jgi:hypothetical protein
MSESYSYGWTDLSRNEDWDFTGPDGKRMTPDRVVRQVLAGELHRHNLKSVIRFDSYQAHGHGANWIHADMATRSRLSNDDNVYRVSIYPDGVDVIGFGLFGVDSFFEGHYSRPDDLPEWVKERLAVLMITSAIPPTQEVEGVGRRISSHVFWVYAPERT